LLILVGFTGYLLWHLISREWTRYEGEHEWAKAVAEVERTDTDWTWERLNATRKKAPQGENSAEVIPKIKALIHPDWGKQFNSETWSRQIRTVPPNERFSPVVIAEVRRDLAASAQAVQLARTLKTYHTGTATSSSRPILLRLS
jgi:hypothetical protein